MDAAHILLLVSTSLILLAVAGAALLRQAGAPLLLMFLGIGMLAGEEGPGQIFFNDYGLAYGFGSLALALILFDGGLGTSLRRLRGVLRPSLTLATAGVLITAGITAAGAHYLFGLGWIESLLMGAIVSSTDAAAVLMLIAGRELKARPRVATTLEAESGFNDPMAVIMVTALVTWLGAGEAPSPWLFAIGIVWSLIAGALIGWFGGRAIAVAERRMGLPLGLYPIFAAASAVFLFALAQSIGASGFLAAYLAGVALRSAPKRRAAEATARFSDGVAWLSQIGLFLMLGLLVTPSHALAVAVPALGVALVLILVARPLAVLVCLLPEKFRPNERAFIAWMGLRGAVPIFLGGFPVLLGVENANLYFSTAFAVVIASLVIQGWTAGPVSRLARIAPPIEGRKGWRDMAAIGAVTVGFAGASFAASIAAGLIDRQGPVFSAPTVAELREMVAPPSSPSSGGVRLGTLPADWMVLDMEERRRLFARIVASLIASENEHVLRDRATLERFAGLEANGTRLDLSQQAERDRLARKYGGAYGDLDDLLARADIVPPSLAISQAVLATGWGSSEAARERNVLFGRFPGDGGFESLAASAEDYVSYLNSHPAFAGFRAERAALRAAGAPITGPALVGEISPYADDETYVGQLRAVMDGPDALTRFDPVTEG